MWRLVRVRYLLVLAVVLGAVAVLLPAAAGVVGRWLVVGDTLESSPAVVVLSGRVPFRAMRAASIYKAGLAGEVWVTRPVQTPEELALRRLGIPDVKAEEERNQQVLERTGVPAGAIRILDRPVINTVAEIELVAEQLRRAGADRVILVSSKPHTRRVKATWASLVGRQPRLMVQYPEQESFDPERWWRQTADALEVSREVFGLMNVWAGFPVRPDRAEASALRGAR